MKISEHPQHLLENSLGKQAYHPSEISTSQSSKATGKGRLRKGIVRIQQGTRLSLEIAM